MKLRPRLSLSQVFAPKELCDLPATLYVVRRGVAAKNGMPMITAITVAKPARSAQSAGTPSAARRSRCCAR